MIDENKIELWHYSYQLIDTDEFIFPNKKHNLHSCSEFKVWGHSRAFFYINQNDVAFDKGINTTYLYSCSIPEKQIYRIDLNENNYKGSLEEKYNQSKKDGYTAWSYHLSGDKNYPLIVCSFEPVLINKKLKFSNNGYRAIDEILIDYAIGTIQVDTYWNKGEFFVMQRDGEILTLLNSYIENSTDRGFLEVFQWRDVILYPQYENSVYRDEINKAQQEYIKS